MCLDGPNVLTVDGRTPSCSLRDHLLAVVVVNRDRVDRTGAGGELRVQFRVVGYLADEDTLLDFLAVREDRLPLRFVLLEGVPFGDTLEHPDTDVLVEFDLHAMALDRSA